jgi:hypothetical protein
MWISIPLDQEAQYTGIQSFTMKSSLSPIFSHSTEDSLSFPHEFGKKSPERHFVRAEPTSPADTSPTQIELGYTYVAIKTIHPLFIPFLCPPSMLPFQHPPQFVRLPIIPIPRGRDDVSFLDR